MSGEEGDVTLSLYDEDGDEIVTELVSRDAGTKIMEMMHSATGREETEMFRICAPRKNSKPGGSHV